MDKSELLETSRLINAPIYEGRSAVDIAQELAQRGQTVASWKSWQEQQVKVALESGELTPQEATSAVLKMNLAAGLIQLILAAEAAAVVADLSNTDREPDSRVVLTPEANEMGSADGMVAAQTVALVFLSRYVPALYGALTLANAGAWGLRATAFFEAMASDAYGPAWPWRGKDVFDETYEAKWTYIEAFTSSFVRALESGATADRAIQDVGAELDVPASAPAGSRRILAWTAAMGRFGQRAWAEQERLGAERAAHLARGRPAVWILPAPRAMGWLERGSVGREYPTRVESAPGGYVAAVQSRATGKDVYRAFFASRSDAEREAAAFVSVRRQIARLPHLRELDHSLDLVVFQEPLGKDALARVLRMADSIDRHARGIGMGVFNDDDAWHKIQAGDVAGLLARLPTLPFQWPLPSKP